MKFNLKNRPKKDSVFFIDYNIWFEGFEKELRDLVKKEKHHPDFTVVFIKEILGK